jgi:hypothetical protein
MTDPNVRATRAYFKIFDERPPEAKRPSKVGGVDDEGKTDAEGSPFISNGSATHACRHVREMTNITGGSKSSEDGERAGRATYP